MNYSEATAYPPHNPGEIIEATEQELHQVNGQVNLAAENGVMGRNITLLPTTKNVELREDYCLTDAQIIEIIRSLEPFEIDKIAFSNNETHPNDIIIVYLRGQFLQPAFKVNASPILVPLYIKVTFPYIIEALPMIILSFHQQDAA